MSKHSNFVLVASLILTLTGCDSGSHAGDRVPELKTRICVPEAELMSPPPSTSNGIVGGQKVRASESESTKVMMIFGDGYICTAAAIAPDVLLTAGHCITTSAAKMKVFFSSSISCESGFNINEQDMVVTETVVYEKYNKDDGPSAAVGDVALVFLKSKIPSQYPVYKIADPDKLTDENKLYFYGYGAVGYEKGGSGILRKVSMPHSKYEVRKGENKVFLDQSGGQGICSGDSGGPGLVNIDNELQILGVNSYVDGPKSDLCLGQSALSLASSYRSWIESKMNARGKKLKK